jgi:hypothetical protein
MDRRRSEEITTNEDDTMTKQIGACLLSDADVLPGSGSTLVSMTIR